MDELVERYSNRQRSKKIWTDRRMNGLLDRKSARQRKIDGQTERKTEKETE
jgi:hypothetical protein